MRVQRCSVEYLGDVSDLFPVIPAATVLGTFSTPMNVSVLQHGDGRMDVIDIIHDATVEDFHDHSIISGKSDRAAEDFGPEQALVQIQITPYGRCVGCGS